MAFRDRIKAQVETRIETPIRNTAIIAVTALIVALLALAVAIGGGR